MRKEGTENMTLTWHIESNIYRAKQKVTYLMHMSKHDWTRSEKDMKKKTNIAMMYKKKEVMVSHDHLHPEGMTYRRKYF